MNTTQQVGEVLVEWRRLSELEAKAIRAAIWKDVEKFQLQKLNLQGILSEIMKRWSKDNSPESPQGVSIRTEFKSLVVLEELNAKLILEQKQGAREAKTALQQTSLNLRRVHHSYSTKQEAAWHSYS